MERALLTSPFTVRVKRRDERGVFAILYAMLAVVLLGVAALAVDIGNGVARKSDVQGQADFAALAAAYELGSQTSGTVPAAAVDEARDSLNDNRPLNRGTCPANDEPATPCVTSAQLTDGNLDNGEVRFANGGLQVITAKANVAFGFGNVFGIEDADVQGSATVGLFSPLGVMPLYAVNPCDYGRQTITDPATGHVTPEPITGLSFPTDTNNTDLASLTPTQIALNATPPVTLTITGSTYSNTTKVGFFRTDGSAPLEVTDIGHPTPYTSNPSANLTVTIPAAVLSTEAVWYVRVFDVTNPGQPPADWVGQWSPMPEALPLRIGEPVLECDAGSSDGNFGTLKFERTDLSSVNAQLAMNMAVSLQEPLSLAVHAQWNSTGLCAEGVDGAVTSDLPNPGLRTGTNCVDTDTGLPANGATAGLITGDGIPAPGRLDSKDTTEGCDPSGGSAEARATIQSTDYDINNDVLTCFLTDGTTSLADITSRNYNGGAVLDPSIYDSPRFFFVPVLHVEPSSGGSNKYSIVDFRPAFFTDEVVASTSIRGSHTASSASGDSPGNGIYVEHNQVKQVKVIFFNMDALPSKTDGDVTGYMGAGPRIIRLID